MIMLTVEKRKMERESVKSPGSSFSWAEPTSMKMEREKAWRSNGNDLNILGEELIEIIRMRRSGLMFSSFCHVY